KRLRADLHDVDAHTSLSIAIAHVDMQVARLSGKGKSSGELDAAVAQVEKALAADPGQTFYADLLVIGYAYQAELFSLRGDFSRARELYQKSLKTAETL